MRIAIDARAATATPSGVGVYTRNLVAGLAERGGADEFHLLSNRPIGLDAPLPAGFQRHETPHPIGNLWLHTACARYLRRRAIDVFHGTNFLAPLKSPCPTVLTVHDLTSLLLPHLHAWRNNVVQRLLPTAIRRAARVIAVSENTRRDLRERLCVPDEKIRVVYNAIGAAFSPMLPLASLATARRTLDLPAQYFLYVGTLERRKNVTTLLKAFAAFTRRHDNGHHLVLAGNDGPGADEIRLVHRQLGLGDRVRFAGYVDAAHLPALYRLARALVYPSVYEGFGLPPIEAMACGTPVVVADNSALAEVAGPAAWKTPGDDARRLAEQLRELAADDALHAQLANAGPAHARRYSLARFAEETFAVYREAVEAAR
jgi:glycosyltransferase involved in cell wall biosynthesis